MKFRSSLVLFATCAPLFLGCAATTDASPEGAADPDSEVGSAESALLGSVTQAVIVPLSPTTKVLRLLDASNQIVLQLNANAFNALMTVADPNTGTLVNQNVIGSKFLGVARNPNNGMVAIAVRGFVFAGTSFDMVFRIAANSAAFVANPSAPSNLKLLPFDGLSNSGVLATNTMLTRPFIDILPTGPTLSYAATGRLTVKTSSVSGTTHTIVYAPNGHVFSCVRVGPAAPRCPVPAP
jgi:hypothetical protein